VSATEVWVLDYVMNSLWQAPAIFAAARGSESMANSVSE
jgi:hypothetical protein